MLTIDKLYHLFKPFENENRLTEFPLIIGGGGGALNIVKGGWILSALRSNTLSKGDYKNYTLKQDDTINSELTQIIKTDYQLDFFINPSDKEKAIIHFKEAEKMRTFLNSLDCIQYLKELEAEILPSLKEIKYFSEFAEQKIFVNRAIIEFSIISKSVYNQGFYKIDKIDINNQIIGA